ncbi:hypothetical protein [Hafnia phage yong3]|nr:hypothetical protein [Hafnia phage yong3]
MSIIDDYNKGKIGPQELNRLLHEEQRKREESRRLSFYIWGGFLCATLVGGLYFNHIWKIREACDQKYPIYWYQDSQVDIDAKLDLRKLCRKGQA